MSAPGDPAPVGVIGGSGLYEFLADAREVQVETPFGAPSDPVTIGDVGGRPVAFVPRHGRDHRFPPHRVNYRANLWALRAVGVRQVLAPCAVGSLRLDLPAGSFVVPDQVVDRTWGREHSVYDGVGPVVHVSLADPYCPVGRRVAVETARAGGWDAVDGGTLVVVEGPRFSTRAESRWHAAQGWSVVGMTGHPEAILARELGLCYTSLTLVTDLDAGAETGEGVSHEEVLEVFAANVGRMRTVLFDVVGGLPPVAERDCLCVDPWGGQQPGIVLP
jgi:5'-methylthioadenosine phosphorylase